MSSFKTDEEFFNRKRPWSLIKDQVLGSYMPAYLAKLSTKSSKIVLVDAFAGPGIFVDEDTGERSPGSPLIMCTQAEKYAPEKYIAYFGNIRQKRHIELTSVLERIGGGLVSKGKAVPLLGDNRVLLTKVQNILQDQTVLVYLDPFGITGCDFETIVKPFLQRNKEYSTEIIFNMSIPVLYRLAAKNSVKKGQLNPQVISHHQTLTKMLGGEWWKDILLNESLTTEEQAWKVVQRYVEQLNTYLPYSGFCPVREKEKARIKYFITFCSRSPDAMLLLNDIMCRAYNEYIVPATYGIGLFKNISWKDSRPSDALEEKVLDKIKSVGVPVAKQDLWLQLVKANFMLFTRSEYNEIVRKLVRLGKLTYRGTQRLNDESLLLIAEASQQTLW